MRAIGSVGTARPASKPSEPTRRPPGAGCRRSGWNSTPCSCNALGNWFVRFYNRAGGCARLVEGRVVAIETSRGEIPARCVIDASGGGHWLARQSGLTIRAYSRPLLARYGYVQGMPKAADDAPRLVADAEGWTWAAPVRPGIWQWTRLLFSGQPPDRDWMPPELRRFSIRAPARGADVTWRRVTEPAGSGYFLVGDAAAVLDPASSHGVLKTLMSGIMAGHLLGELNTPGTRLTEPEAAEEYSRWLSSWFDHDVARLNALYGLLGTRLALAECNG